MKNSSLIIAKIIIIVTAFHLRQFCINLTALKILPLGVSATAYLQVSCQEIPKPQRLEGTVLWDTKYKFGAGRSVWKPPSGLVIH